jgi:hypothetical protein
MAVSILSWFRSCKRVLRPLLSVAFFAATTLIVFYYGAIHKNQIVFYLTTGSAAAVFAGLCRYTIATTGCAGWKPIAIATLECAIYVLVVAAAVTAQCEHLGVKHSSASASYDFYHGQWHALLALATALIYSRAAAASHAAEEHFTCISTLPALDWIGLLLLAVYSCVVIACKESQLALFQSKCVHTAVMACLLVHAVQTAYFSVKQRGSRRSIHRHGRRA